MSTVHCLQGICSKTHSN
uniref:Uncharacterized protein n=1 Tax=Arundo donax TaxID=35708 RepID=A0A0A8YTV8_ARUDO